MFSLGKKLILRKEVVQLVTLVVAVLGLGVTTVACVVAAVQTVITKRTFEDEIRRRSRPVLVPSWSPKAKVSKVAGGLRITATVPVLNHGGGPAYRLRIFKCLQIPPLNYPAASKEEVLSSLAECRTAFDVTSSGRVPQLVVGNGQTYEIDLVDEVHGEFPGAASIVIKRRLYVLALYENEAHKEVGTVFSLSFEFSLSDLENVETHIQDTGVLEDN